MVEVPAPEHLKLIEPMLPESGDPSILPELSPYDWLVVEKLDGFRVGIYFRETRNYVITRGKKDISDKVPWVRDTVVKELIGTVLDAEALAPTKVLWDTKSALGSKPDRALAWQEEHGRVVFHCFDVPQINFSGSSLMDLMDRRKLLRFAVGVVGAVSEDLHITSEEPIERNFERAYAEIVSAGGEGVVLKHRNGLYHPGKRTKDWIKIKRQTTVDVVLLSAIPVQGKGVVAERVGTPDAVGALEYGVYKDGALTRIGTVGGLEDEERKMFAEEIESLVGTTIEISGQEIGKNGALRHPKFIRLRPDKLPTECTWESLR